MTTENAIRTALCSLRNTQRACQLIDLSIVPDEDRQTAFCAAHVGNHAAEALSRYIEDLEKYLNTMEEEED